MNYKDIEDLMKLIDYLRYKKESDNSSSIIGHLSEGNISIHYNVNCYYKTIKIFDAKRNNKNSFQLKKLIENILQNETLLVEKYKNVPWVSTVLK